MGLRGGETDDDGNTKTGDYIDAGQEHATFKDQWTYLYGLNGRLPFVPTKWSSFSKVLRQLLHPVNDTQREFTLIKYDPKGGKPELVHDTLPLQRNSPAMAFRIPASCRGVAAGAAHRGDAAKAAKWTAANLIRG